MNTCLAHFNTLPKLIEGKVCILDNSGYSLHSASATTVIKDDFNPLNYSLLPKNSKWGSIVVYSSSSERESYLLFKLIEQQHKSLHIQFHVGDKVHLYSKNGTYSIIEFLDGQVRIGCKKWTYEGRTQIVDRKDLKCKQGNRF
jgi:hypothetical protein